MGCDCSKQGDEPEDEDPLPLHNVCAVMERPNASNYIERSYWASVESDKQPLTTVMGNGPEPYLTTESALFPTVSTPRGQFYNTLSPRTNYIGTWANALPTISNTPNNVSGPSSRNSSLPPSPGRRHFTNDVITHPSPAQSTPTSLSPRTPRFESPTTPPNQKLSSYLTDTNIKPTYQEVFIVQRLNSASPSPRGGQSPTRGIYQDETPYETDASAELTDYATTPKKFGIYQMQIPQMNSSILGVSPRYTTPRTTSPHKQTQTDLRQVHFDQSTPPLHIYENFESPRTQFTPTPAIPPDPPNNQRFLLPSDISRSVTTLQIPLQKTFASHPFYDSPSHTQIRSHSAPPTASSFEIGNTQEKIEGISPRNTNSPRVSPRPFPAGLQLTFANETMSPQTQIKQYPYTSTAISGGSEQHTLPPVPANLNRRWSSSTVDSAYHMDMDVFSEPGSVTMMDFNTKGRFGIRTPQPGFSRQSSFATKSPRSTRGRSPAAREYSAEDMFSLINKNAQTNFSRQSSFAKSPSHSRGKHSSQGIPESVYSPATTIPMSAASMGHFEFDFNAPSNPFWMDDNFTVNPPPALVAIQQQSQQSQNQVIQSPAIKRRLKLPPRLDVPEFQRIPAIPL